MTDKIAEAFVSQREMRESYHADNTAVFRDIKALGYRKVLQDANGVKVIEVAPTV